MSRPPDTLKMCVYSTDATTEDNGVVYLGMPMSVTMFASVCLAIAKEYPESYIELEEREPDDEETDSYDSVNVYTKKPITIRAILWSGANKKAVKDFLGDDLLYFGADGSVKIRTATGNQEEAVISDYILEGVAGDHYPCKAATFFGGYDHTPDAIPEIVK